MKKEEHFFKGLLYSGLSCQEPRSQELNCRRPPSLMSTTWRPGLTTSPFEHPIPAVWLSFLLHSRLPAWRSCSSRARALTAALQAESRSLKSTLYPSASCVNKSMFMWATEGKGYRISSQFHVQEYRVPLLFPVNLQPSCRLAKEIPSKREKTVIPDLGYRAGIGGPSLALLAAFACF